MNAQRMREGEELPVDERPLKGVTLKTILSIVGATAISVAAWLHLEGKTSANAEKIAAIEAERTVKDAVESKDHDLLIRMNGKLDELIATQGLKARSLAAAQSPAGPREDND